MKSISKCIHRINNMDASIGLKNSRKRR